MADDLILLVVKGSKYKTIIDKTKLTTPPNLLGIDRKMAYANKKYHSGLMWTGVTSELAGKKFSESPKAHGHKSEIVKRPITITIHPTKSFVEK